MKKKIYLILGLSLLAAVLIFTLKNQTSSDSGEVTLEWDASPESISGYKIYYGLESGKYIQPKGKGLDLGLTDNPSQPRYILKNLESGKTYYFAVTTYDTKGIESDFSGEVSKSVK